MESAKIIDQQQFRDKLANVDRSGKRLWIFPKKPKGPLYNYRTWFSWLLMGLMFVGPWIKFHDKPLLMLNVLDRKFIIFGMVFWPQDLNLFALLMLTFVLFIILFTVVFGRVWCGWACPQTVFMEMLFRKVEYLIEGDANQQKKLQEADWTFEKIWKKGLKHGLFWVLSFIIANTFLAYIISIDELKLLVEDGPARHLGKFMALILFTTVFYFVFARLRELVCIFICPYGRLQGLMLDKNSIVVAYDFVRGEPRGRMVKDDPEKKGDCVDCKLCVQVCPTGIDIRNGTQLECVNCTACIDACDEVMVKINKPKGLVRFASLNGITRGKKFAFNPRNIAYSAVLTLLFSVFLFALITRSDIETTLLRTPGMLYQKQENNQISNLYNIEFVNKTFKDLDVKLKLIEPKGTIKMVENDQIHVDPESVAKVSFFVLRDAADIQKVSTPVKIEVYSNGELIETMKSKFNGPIFKKQ